MPSESAAAITDQLCRKESDMQKKILEGIRDELQAKLRESEAQYKALGKDQYYKGRAAAFEYALALVADALVDAGG